MGAHKADLSILQDCNATIVKLRLVVGLFGLVLILDFAKILNFSSDSHANRWRDFKSHPTERATTGFGKDICLS